MRGQLGPDEKVNFNSTGQFRGCLPPAADPMTIVSRGAIHIFLSVAWVSAVGKGEAYTGVSMGVYPFRNYVINVTQGF
jgi:hypothetical protein